MNSKILRRLSVAAAAVLLGPAVAASPAFANPAAPTVTEVGTSVVIGQTVAFTFTELDGSEPTAYRWMINGGELTGTATAIGGEATADVLATRMINVIEVYAIGADGSIGDSATATYLGTAPAAYADQDLNGDGRPDLAAAVGDALLVADGTGAVGQVRVPATNLVPTGNGVGGTFAGLQVITGKFAGGPFEDYLAYNPATGYVFVYEGLGEADVTNLGLLAKHENTAWLADLDGNAPVQVIAAAAAGDLAGILGSATAGYHLAYYVSHGGLGLYDLPIDTGASTPDGGSDWASWRLASKLLPNGTAVSLWKPSTGALYLWEGVAFDADSGKLSYTQYQLSTGFRRGADGTTLRLTDFNADGVPDVWAVSAEGSVTPYRISRLSATGTATIKAGAPQSLV